EEHEHQPPTAADAVRPVAGARAEGADPALAPAAEYVVHRAPAMPKAHALERRQLVDAGQPDRRGDDVRAGAVPVEESVVDAADDAVQRVRGESVHGPDEEVTGDEHPGRHERLATPLALG